MLWTELNRTLCLSRTQRLHSIRHISPCRPLCERTVNTVNSPRTDPAELTFRAHAYICHNRQFITTSNVCEHKEMQLKRRKPSSRKWHRLCETETGCKVWNTWMCKSEKNEYEKKRKHKFASLFNFCVCVWFDFVYNLSLSSMCCWAHNWEKWSEVTNSFFFVCDFFAIKSIVGLNKIREE